MASENETVSQVVADLKKIIGDRIEAAHRREVDTILKDRDDMYKSEQETIAKTNAWFEEYQTLKREVAELRECLKEAVCDNCEGCDFKKTKSGCEDCSVQKWRKALEGAKDDNA